jgi:chorismate lyase/3-hydroxybenzoate synthase
VSAVAEKSPAALRIESLTSDGRYTAPMPQHGQLGRVQWGCDDHWLFGDVHIAAAAASGDLTDLSRQVYADIFATLAQTSMPHLVRLWNYLPDINLAQAGLERYRQFNLGRQQAFLDAGRDAFAGAPAACALGTHGGPFSVRFLAGRSPVLPLENPRQVPAWRYPTEFGPRSPSFSRAVLVASGNSRLTLFISGTASIIGHASVHPGDVLAQTDECLRNLQAMVDTANAQGTACFQLDSLACTVYVRQAEQIPQVRQRIEAWVGATSVTARQARFVAADICRAELLVEIEAHATAEGQCTP